MNCQNENYFAPLEKMLEFFYSKAISNKNLINIKRNSIDYFNVSTQELVTEKKVRENNEYNGHKIF